MEEDYKYIGRIMKAARRYKKENQESVSKAIGCSQSALSKLEHGTLVPSAPQWFDFCRYLEIPVTSLETGVIDRQTKLNKSDLPSNIKWNKRYRVSRGIKSRELFPFVSFLRQNKGDAGVDNMFSSLDLDLDLAVDFDHQISQLIILDIMNYFIKNNICPVQEVKKIGERFASPVMHGNIFKEYTSKKSLKDILQSFIDHQNLYQSDIHYQLEQVSENECQLKLSPEKSLIDQYGEQSSDVAEFYRYYQKSKLETFLTSLLQGKVSVNQIGSLAPQGFPERFEIKINY